MVILPRSYLYPVFAIRVSKAFYISIYLNGKTHGSDVLVPPRVGIVNSQFCAVTEINTEEKRTAETMIIFPLSSLPVSCCYSSSSPSKWSTDVNETHHQWRCLWRKLTDRRRMYSTINFLAGCEMIFDERRQELLENKSTVDLLDMK